MPDAKIEPEYSFVNQYKLWATVSQLFFSYYLISQNKRLIL